MRYLLIAALIFRLDQYYKRSVEQKMKPGRDAKIAAGGKILIRRVENKGIAGGFFSSKAPYVKVVSTAVAGLAGLRFLTLLPMRRRVLKKISYAFLLGGAASNLYDRWMRGSVTDYISVVDRRVKGLSRVVFNLADVFIVLGGLPLMLMNLFGRKK